jgi:hypothetical protein
MEKRAKKRGPSDGFAEGYAMPAEGSASLSPSRGQRFALSRRFVVRDSRYQEDSWSEIRVIKKIRGHIFITGLISQLDAGSFQNFCSLAHRGYYANGKLI